MTETAKATEALMLGTQVPKRGGKLPLSHSGAFAEVLTISRNPSGAPPRHDLESLHTVESRLLALLDALVAPATDQADAADKDVELVRQKGGTQRKAEAKPSPEQSRALPKLDEKDGGEEPEAQPADAAAIHPQPPHEPSVEADSSQPPGSRPVTNPAAAERMPAIVAEERPAASKEQRAMSQPVPVPDADLPPHGETDGGDKREANAGRRNPTAITAMKTASQRSAAPEPETGRNTSRAEPLPRASGTALPAASSPAQAPAQALSTTTSALISDLNALPELANAAVKILPSSSESNRKILHGIKIQLHPAELGSVSVKMMMSGTQLSVEIQPETAEAYKRLSADGDGMMRALRGLGFDVDRIVVQQPQGGGPEIRSGTDGFHAAAHQGQPDARPQSGARREESGRQHIAGRATEDPGDGAPAGDLYI